MSEGNGSLSEKEESEGDTYERGEKKSKRTGMASRKNLLHTFNDDD